MNLTPVKAGEIEKIKTHLAAGHQVTIVTYTKVTKLGAKQADYIRASKDGKGYRLGWPGKPSVYAFPGNVFLVPAGMEV